MLTTRKQPLEMEAIRWLILFMLAIIVIAIAAQLAGAADPMPPVEPGRLPMALVVEAKPMDPPREFYPEQPPVHEAPAGLAMKVAELLALHRQGAAREALDGWEQTQLPPQTAVWRDLARGAAALQLGDLPLAEKHLATARLAAPKHAAADFLIGVLRMEQAAQIREWRPWRDLPRRPEFRLVADAPPVAAPLTRTMYELAALMEFNAAVLHAPDVQLGQPLVPGARGNPQPLVGDLLAAIGADNFAGKAHHMLGALYMNRGQLTEAETHLDEAVKTGVNIVFGYEDLGTLHELQGDNAAAGRLYGKQLLQKCPPLARWIATPWNRTAFVW